MPSLRLFLSFLFVSCLFGLPSCKPELEMAVTDPNAPKKIIYLAANNQPPFEQNQVRMLTQLAATDPKIILEIQDAHGDSRKQAAQLLKAAAARPFAILIRPVDPTMSFSVVAKSGILVIGLGDESISSGCTTVVSCDETELGRLAGKLAVDVLTRKAKEASLPEATGRLVEIRGDDNAPNCTQRHEGFTDALKAAPGLILVHDAPGGWTRDGGSERTRDALRLQQTFNIVYAHNDLMALGVAEAATGDLRKSLYIIGTDGLAGAEGGLALLSQKQIDASIYQPPLIDLAWAILRKRIEDPAFKPKKTYSLMPCALTHADIADFLRTGPPPLPPL